MTTKLSRKLSVLAVAAAVIVVDQLTKWSNFRAHGSSSDLLVQCRLGMQALYHGCSRTPVVSDTPRIEVVLMLAALALIAAIGLRAVRAGVVPAWVVGLLVGGGASIIYDRAVLHVTRDFLPLVPVVELSLPANAQNAAGLAIVLGLIALPFAIWRRRRASGTPVAVEG